MGTSDKRKFQNLAISRNYVCVGSVCGVCEKADGTKHLKIVLASAYFWWKTALPIDLDFIA